jgi:hypothetical protein
MISHTSRPTLTRYDLKLAYALSLLIALVMAGLSAAALSDGVRVYVGAPLDLLPLFIGQDALNLVVGLPILLGAMWLAGRGSLIGLLLWPGALFYIVYDYAFYVLGAPFSIFFLPYIALVTLSAYTMIGILAGIDAAAVRDRIEGHIPVRLTGGFLAGVALLFTVLWTGMSISAIASGVELAMVPRVVTILDLTVQLPALFVGGILLLRRRPLGYVVAAGLLLQAASYLIGLSAVTVLHEQLTRTPFDPIAVLSGIIVGLISLTLIGCFVGASAGTGRRASVTDGSVRAIPARP